VTLRRTHQLPSVDRLGSRRSNPGRHNGSVLIIVLWIAFGLVALALYLGNSMGLELRAADNHVSLLAAEQTVDGAARYVMQVLAEQGTNGLVPYRYDYASEAVALADTHFWLIGRNDGQTAPNQVTFGLVDESSKLNINNTNVTVAMLEMLPRMTPELAAAIIDWRDADDQVTAGGAEAETYALRRPPYYCKNAPFDSVDELRLVAGATMEILLGEDLNRNGVLDPNETDDNRNGLADPGVLEYITVHSAESNLASDGGERVDINSDEELDNLITDILGSGVQQRVRLAIGSAASNPMASVLEFYHKSGLTAAEFEQIETEITVETGPLLPGKVNVNTASAVVLACIPGIGDDGAAALVSYRLSNPDATYSISWVKEVLTEAQILDAGPYLTGQSYQFSADIVALGKFGRGYRRARFVFDMTEGTPKIVYRQSLSHLGWALGLETRQNWLATATP
jgi:type II secretory pathway component PulK